MEPTELVGRFELVELVERAMWRRALMLPLPALPPPPLPAAVRTPHNTNPPQTPHAACDDVGAWGLNEFNESNYFHYFNLCVLVPRQPGNAELNSLN